LFLEVYQIQYFGTIQIGIRKIWIWKPTGKVREKKNFSQSYHIPNFVDVTMQKQLTVNNKKSIMNFKF
jgi:hypothetical protein